MGEEHQALDVWVGLAVLPAADGLTGDEDSLGELVLGEPEPCATRFYLFCDLHTSLLGETIVSQGTGFRHQKCLTWL